jgi:hypothetical protein
MSDHDSQTTGIACVTALAVCAMAVVPARPNAKSVRLAATSQEKAMTAQGKVMTEHGKVMTEQAGFYCNWKALSAEERQSHHALTVKLEAARVETKEFPDGYALRFKGGAASPADLAQWISNESKCCPFFDFTIELQRDGGPLWLQLTGKDGIKPFIRMEFHL